MRNFRLILVASVYEPVSLLAVHGAGRVLEYPSNYCTVLNMIDKLNLLLYMLKYCDILNSH